MGPELLLKTLRGEPVDWKAIEDKFTPHSRCQVCQFLVFKTDFSAVQWRRVNGDKLPVCKPCLEKKKKQAGTPFECMSCHQWKAAGGFHYMQMGNRHLRRVCADCHDKRRCVGPCNLLKNDFTEDQWKKALKQQGKCKECMTRNCETK